MHPVGTVLGRVLEGLGLTQTLEGWRAAEAWPRVVGPRIAARTHVAAFRDGTLHVEVEGSAWLHEIGFLKRDLLRRMGQEIGPGVVRDLRFSMRRGGTPR